MFEGCDLYPDFPEKVLADQIQFTLELPAQ
mgnify:CR=1 FL=1|jgi:hypothetical protein